MYMKHLAPRIARTTILMAGLMVASLPMFAGTPEQVVPQGEQQVPAVQVQEPTKKTAEPVRATKPALPETPLQDMWEGVLEFIYGVESDSTRTR